MAYYFDNASTTPVDPRVVERMSTCLSAHGTFGNPASTTHGFGWFASEEVEWARNTVAEVIDADPREIVWTSGATEADNLAIQGVVDALSAERGRNRIVTLASEHKAVLDTCAHLTGCEVVVLKPNPHGLIDLDALAEALTEQTLLVTVMLVNNETGVIQPIRDIADMAHQAGALMHSDLAQAIGKVDVSVQALDIDLASLSAHKTHGPKGIGALYVRRTSAVRIAEQQHGGGHERGMRSGTLPTHQIVGMAEAYRLAQQDLEQEYARIEQLKAHVIAAVSALEDVQINGHNTVPHILNLTIKGVDAEPLMAAMPDIGLSTGSACNSATLEPSHVLQSMGLTRADGLSSVRISFGRTTTREAVDHLIHSLTHAVQSLRSRS
jgi:cysteine desulfurase